MTGAVITVTEDTPIEEAARIMSDNKIGGLPVVRDGSVVGIITETDLFRLLLVLTGAREFGVRATFLLEDKPGELAKVTSAIAENGGANLLIYVRISPQQNIHSKLVDLSQTNFIKVKTFIARPN